MHTDEIEVDLEFDGIPTYCLVEYEYDGFPSQATITGIFATGTLENGESDGEWDRTNNLKDKITGKQEGWLSEQFAQKNSVHEEQAWAYEAECERLHGR